MSIHTDNQRILAPFTPEQVEALNHFQHKGRFHPFTGDAASAGRKSRSECPDRECLLIATPEGWVCPCGSYTQNWAHSFMIEKR